MKSMSLMVAGFHFRKLECHAASHCFRSTAANFRAGAPTQPLETSLLLTHLARYLVLDADQPFFDYS